MEHSVGPNDVLIVEGVPALLMEDLLGLPGVMRGYIDIARDTRDKRLMQDYTWRSTSTEEQLETLAQRELDETPIVEQSRMIADFVVEPAIQGNKE
jgi:uridine kinase